MKIKNRSAPITKAQARTIIKLCYILIMTVELYILKVNIYPESAYESMLAKFATELMLEHILYAFLILICGAVLLERRL